MVVTLNWSELAARLRSPAGVEALAPVAGTACIVVEGRCAIDEPPAWPPCPVIALAPNEAPMAADVVATDQAQVDLLTAAIERNPIAAAVLVRLLRCNERAGVADGLFAESLAYSSLQHGAEFHAWLAGRKVRRTRPESETPAVLLQRAGGALRITLNQPHKRNAYSSVLRDALCEALALVVEDGSIRRVVLDGAGTCFSAGGDLDEFGEATDAGIAHVSRMTRSAGALIHRLRNRIEARLHGACIGAGIELPAFAARVVAQHDAFFQLPEVGMGLIPGAGGTVGILSRIGRQRLAFMALTGVRVSAETALDWGLVDAVGEW